MTPNQEFIKRILCLHCKHMVDLKQKESYDGSAIAFVICDTGLGVLNKYPRTKCPRYKADCLKQPEQGDCEKCSPINRGWCYGDCEKCANHDEWKEWAE